MPAGSKSKVSGQAEEVKGTTTAKVANTAAKVDTKAEAKKTEPKNEEPKKEEVKKEEPKKAEPQKEAPKKEAPAVKEAEPKAAKKMAAKGKKAVKEPVVPEVKIQFDDENGTSEADLTDITAKIKASYVAEGHRESSIKALRIYIKPQDRKAYYVINNKLEGQIDLF